jgi:uncharacterized DUF497 family protein
MKYFEWNEEKNQKLKEGRNISFEEIIFAINTGYLVDVIVNPKNIKYSNQAMFVVEIEKYIYLVPFVEDDEKYFLKTIYPSRKATDKYLGK